MQRLRCLVWDQGNQRITVHRRADLEPNLYIDLHRYGRQRGAVRDRVGNTAGADGDAGCEPEHGQERQWLNPDLVIN